MDKQALSAPTPKTSGAPSRPHRAAERPIYAALDLGTNNCRMLVAAPQRRGFRVIDSFSRIVRLGEDVAKSGKLSDDAMDRTLAALKVCARKMAFSHVTSFRAVATEACRCASNSKDFLDYVKHDTGISLEIIPAEQEASLALKGCAALLAADAPNALVFDIGGGSTEIMWVNLDPHGHPVLGDVISLPVGVVSMSERYQETGGPYPQAAYEAIVERVSKDLTAFDKRNGIFQKVEQGIVQMLGTSGTVTTLGALHLDLPKYLRSKVDGLEIEFDRISEISHKLAAMDCAERAALPCIGQSRADLVVSGCAILEAICQHWPVGSLKIADRGIREGILLELMEKDGRNAA